MQAANTLYYGDNLDVLRKHIADESVDLIYLDPPFNSNRDYNLLFKEQSGEPAQAQIKAFTAAGLASISRTLRLRSSSIV